MKMLPGSLRLWAPDPPPADPIPPPVKDGEKPADKSLIGDKPEEKSLLNGADKTAKVEGEVKVEEKKVEAPIALTLASLKLPEGVEKFDEKLTTKFLAAMNDAALSPVDRANALIALQAEAMKAVSEGNNTLWRETQEGWKKEVEALPDIGGVKLPETLAGIRKLVDTYGTPEVLDAFDLTGAGNNPHVIKFLAKIVADMGEGKPLSGKPAAQATTMAERLYPNQGKA